MLITKAGSHLAVVFAAVLLTACATTPKFNEGRLTVRPEPLSRLYMYSFLDVMDEKFGKKFLQEVRVELDRSLDASGVSHQQLWFKDPEVPPWAALVTERSGYHLYGGANESTTVPVAGVVANNRPREQEYGAIYRLVVFPSATSSTGTGLKHSIRWVLMDAKSDRTLWDTTSEIEMVLWWSANENAAERARVLVAGLITEWKRLGFIGRAEAPSVSDTQVRGAGAGASR